MEEDKKTNVDPTPNPSGNEGDNNVGTADLDDGKKPEPKANPEAGDNDNGGGDAGDGKGKNAPTQSREDDAKNAERRRREKAKAEEEQKAHDDKIREQAEFNVKKGQVTSDELKDLGLEKVDDPEQLYLVEKYRKAKADGKENPVAEAYISLSNKQRDERKTELAAAEAQAKTVEEERQIVAKEQGEVKKKYGKTTGEILRDEPEFKEFFDTYGKAGTFDACYSSFHKIKGDSDKAAKKAGTFPTSGTGKGNEGSSTETDEQFLARTKARYGNGF